jgi:glyoxylase-like metal-dependent hydrolase (beta-lactamase superfamily II)
MGRVTMQIVPNVYLVNGFPYGVHQNGYAVECGGEVAMIDSGDLEGDSFELVKKNCSAWGIDLARASMLLVTHSHFDHSSHV